MMEYIDITTKVIIEIITFNVKFFDINDELIYEEEVKWGDKATFKDVPEEENKEFIGWYYYDDIFDIDEIVPYSMDLKAKYKNVMGDNYKLLTDDDFQPLGYNNLYKYIGSERYVVVPEKINGETVKSTENMFANTNVISVSFETPENIKNTSYMFSYLNSDTLLLEFLDTLHVENMQGMFEGVNLYELDFTYFNTENVTNMNAMFRSSTIENFDLSLLNTKNVLNMESMFERFSGDDLILNKLDVSNVLNMKSLFNAADVYKIDVSNLNSKRLLICLKCFSIIEQKLLI